MSLLNRLSIQGIRSFGLEASDAQKIEFTPPVTLIVGENGCGKTTVIECLKYALTGDVPPGSDRGKNFIHDSGNDTAHSCRMGKVMLTVTDSDYVDKTVTRAMKLECVKGKKPKFETLNSTITFTRKDQNQREDVSGRVEDINNYMCETMGVSKSIINNVILCHQEDSNWPLDEGKKLKEKFDAIFGTTDYNKAIEKMIKIRKEYQKQHIEVKSDIKFNEEIKNQVETKERKIKKWQEQYDQNEQKIANIDKELVPLNEKIKKVLEKERDFGKLFTEKSNCKSTLASRLSDTEKLKAKILKNGKLESDMSKLVQQQQNFESNREKRKKKMESLQNECDTLKSSMEKKRNNVSVLNGKIHEYSSDFQRLQDRYSERFEKMQSLCAELSIPFTDDADQSINTQAVADTLHDIKKRIATAGNDMASLKANAQKEDNSYQQKIDKIRDENIKLETNMTSQRNSIKTILGDIDKVKAEISTGESSIPMLKAIQPKIDAVEKMVDKLSNENNMEDLEEQQGILQAEVMELEDTQSSIDSNIEILHASSQFTNELETKMSELVKNQSEYTRLKNKSTSTFKALFPNKTIDSNFRSQMQAKQNELKEAVATTETQIKANLLENERILMQRDNLRREEERIEKEVKSVERKIQDLCGAQEYLNVLEAQKEKVAKQNMELAVLESSKNTYTNYIQKINDVPCCPLCSKDFEMQEADNLIDELKENIDQLPQKIQTIRNALQIETRKFDKLNGLKSSYDNLQQLKSEKVKTAGKLEQLERDLTKNMEDKDDLDMTVSEPQALFEMITPNVIAEMIKLDELQRSIGTKTKEIDAIKLKMPKNIPNISLSDAMAKRKEISESIKSKNENIKKLESQIDMHKSRLMDMREELNRLQSQKNEYQAKAQGIEKLKEQYQKYIKEKDNLEMNLVGLEQQVGPIKQKLEALVQHKREKRKANDEKIEKQQAALNKMQVDETKLDDLNNQIKTLEGMNLESKIDHASLQVKNEQEEMKSIDLQVKEKESEEQEIRDELNKGQVNLYNLQDNIAFLKMEEELRELRAKYIELKESIGSLDHEKLLEKKKKLLDDIEELSTHRSKLQGHGHSLIPNIEELQKELEHDPKYRNAKENYINCVIREDILRNTINDLNKSRSVLEKALLKFHQEKMDQINKTIKSLWNDIYRGNDIDYIMIKTDEEGTASSDKKRSYSYRVCQQKLGGELCEMRGRCSAGQKVLASLIIRIALADTFSSKCGVLALDEPTTNLDEMNARSLSQALNNLIQQRNDGRFMLIIITHDMSFIKSLDQADRYFKLWRDPRGISRIQEVKY